MKTLQVVIKIVEENFKIMEKFQVLEYNQYYMSLIGVDYGRSNYLIKLLKNVYILMGTFAMATMSSAAFIFYHRSNFEAVLQASLPFIAGLQVTGCYLNIRLKVKKIDILNRSLQEIINEGNCNRIKIEMLQRFKKKYSKQPKQEHMKYIGKLSKYAESTQKPCFCIPTFTKRCFCQVLLLLFMTSIVVNTVLKHGNSHSVLKLHSIRLFYGAGS